MADRFEDYADELVGILALAESPDASLNSIAKRAGVANATLYRHFATRESLILEVYRSEVHQVVNAADQLLATRPPIDALQQWAERLARYAMTKHGLAGALRAATNSDAPLFDETYDAIVGELTRLLSAAEQAGDIRPGLDPDDVHSRPCRSVGDRPEHRLEAASASAVRRGLRRPQSLTARQACST